MNIVENAGDQEKQFQNTQKRLRDWMHACEKENNIIENEDVRVNIVSEIEIKKHRNHFVVEIEYKGTKISTSFERTERLLERII